ncbi:uncharacterized protein EDB93DRAFT_1136668, partial [Suillus bovinus]|uniref:uncharacterized protein n=1 Tax=Suillus bovinus TaxID=48563 RepID=UPI001B85C772
MLCFWKYFFASPASESPANTNIGVEPGPESSSENSSSEGHTSLQSDSITTSGSSTSTDTDGPAASTNTSVTEQSTVNAAIVPPPAQDNLRARLRDIDCVDFDCNSNVGSPTINFDSDEATGATFTTPQNMFRPQRPPSTVAHRPQMVHARRRERVTYFGPGTEVDSPTINIRSKRASGAMYNN